ncbi:hypothetical protein LEP1GSC008_1105 [Leptospira kirschneri serovar Bulgarica str. Nikolaevo]|uniref:Uncharacterized protein n=1 Tax=Leptospira kirschneri serovar Bulgarica str. Nikolaevo TaxID=1240687 RepID=M6F445_9LEPT|nr:hypothetical protein LEP1GSC008_1105 [Leptospira kirschneri serovar Bulgarica str. Nikolaevo]
MFIHFQSIIYSKYYKNLGTTTGSQKYRQISNYLQNANLQF